MDDVKKVPNKCLPYPSLPHLEIRLYVTVWICAALYACLALLKVSHEYQNNEWVKYNLIPGWSLFGQKKDVSDGEWRFWRRAIMRDGLLLWLLGHFLLGIAARFAFWQKRSLTFSIYGLCFSVWGMGFAPMAFQLILNAIILMSAWFIGSVRLVWFLSICCLISVNISYFHRFLEPDILHGMRSSRYIYQEYLLTMGIIRSISLALYICEVKERRAKQRQFVDPIIADNENELSKNSCSLQDVPNANGRIDVNDGSGFMSHQPIGCPEGAFNMAEPWKCFVDGCCYMLYMPLALAGPTITFNDFIKQLHQPSKSWTLDRLSPIIKGFVRCAVWGGVLEFLTYFFYNSAMIIAPEVLKSVSRDALISLAYITGQMFMMKYVAIWALAASFTRLDGFQAPGVPACVSRIAFYSDMWKNFDRGLYQFIKTHIYIPLGGSRHGLWRQIFATFMGFSFIWLWHGAHATIFYWILLNCTTIVIEVVAQRISNIPRVKVLEVTHLSPAGSRRLRSLLTVPLLMMSSFGIFTFFGGSESGWIIFYRSTISGFPQSTIILFVLCYCVVQTCKEIENWEAEHLVKVKLG